MACKESPHAVGNGVVDKLSHTVNALGSITDVGSQDIVTQPSCQPDAVKLDDDGQQSVRHPFLSTKHTAQLALVSTHHTTHVIYCY